mgnify:CR=1 FL=1
MSKASWKKEFYPVSAKKPRTKIARIKHSLRKWEGLMPAMFKKHALLFPPVEIDSTTCALCIAYRKKVKGDTRCTSCPLFQTRGRSCDRGKSNPYAFWVGSLNPTPMIRALRKTLKLALAGKG